MKKLIASFVIACGLLVAPCGFSQQSHDGQNLWQVGVAKTVITPRENMWMSGYAARQKAAEGTMHDLWTKAMALEDARGMRALVITADIIGYSREMSVAVCQELMKKFDLKREHIILSSSHTHSGPVINRNLYGIYPAFDEQQKRQIAENLEFVERQMIDVAARAFSNLAPSRLSSGVGIARFAVNRRENNWTEDNIYDAEVKGPSDHAVQVFKVADEQGKPTAVLFGYSCHATCLSGHQWSGDYPGFAQIALEGNNPGLTALFFTGFAGDQNPLPRGKVTQAEQYGRELAVAVEKVMKEPDRPLEANLYASYEEIELAIDPPPGNAELDAAIESSADWHKRWAIAMKEKKARGAKMESSYPYYPIQSWQLGEQSMVILGGEVVVDYAFRLRKALGNELMIMGYANDVMAYIPSERVLKEGGYEGETSMYVYGHDGKWAPGIEDKIVNTAVRQVKVLRKASGIER